MSQYILGALFFVPFIVLLSRKIKTFAASIIALIVMSGVLVERLFFLMPNVKINGLIAGIEMLLMLVLFVLTVANRERVLDQSEV